MWGRFSHKRKPDYVIGPEDNPQLRRWWWLRKKWGGVYLHETRYSDNPTLHDHPYASMSIILKRGYTEEFSGGVLKKRWRFQFIFRRATTAHRLIIEDGAKPCWTLFVIGPRIRDWGFHTKDGWVPFKDFEGMSANYKPVEIYKTN